MSVICYNNVFCSLKAQLAETLKLLDTYQQEQRVSCKPLTGLSACKLADEAVFDEPSSRVNSTPSGTFKELQMISQGNEGRGNIIECCLQL